MNTVKITKKTNNSSLWNYCRDGPSNPLSTNSESFIYKTSITRNIYHLADGNDGYDEERFSKNEMETVVPLKYLSTF